MGWASCQPCLPLCSLELPSAIIMLLHPTRLDTCALPSDGLPQTLPLDSLELPSLDLSSLSSLSLSSLFVSGFAAPAMMRSCGSLLGLPVCAASLLCLQAAALPGCSPTRSHHSPPPPARCASAGRPALRLTTVGGQRLRRHRRRAWRAPAASLPPA